ncbi:hypothetical protein C8A03DRAFT_45123 [Achaetomium macrosporum]|uniref:NAD(P)-binding protein n=1 Tax=Achaetomium macrosporum TaxID=79813 RepID=A0AAN7C9P8_9PEZI|nr:hypothetical protein C8A03DRAFT_45123 [Achaetomium macrosporum]
MTRTPLISPANADLSGKSMLITGASKGLGNATAIHFSMAGCSKIALAARSPLSGVEKEVRAAAVAAGRAEPQILSLSVDVNSEESLREAAGTVSQAFGGSLDMLITNAGYSDEWEPIAQSDPSRWYFMPQVLESSLKTFMTLSSIGAHHIFPGASAYQTTKFAICRLVAIAIHPGGVKTDLAMKMPEQLRKNLIDTPELAADAMVWLAKERREWLAGRYFSCNWDVKELEGRKDEIVENDLLKFRLRI